MPHALGTIVLGEAHAAGQAGVTPIVMWHGDGLPDYDRSNETLVAHESAMDALNDQFASGDASRTPCTQN